MSTLHVNYPPGKGGNRLLCLDLVSADDLDLPAAVVRRRFAHAIEYVGLDGRPCWLAAELLEREVES
jgi:hypothetical protein